MDKNISQNSWIILTTLILIPIFTWIHWEKHCFLDLRIGLYKYKLTINRQIKSVDHHDLLMKDIPTVPLCVFKLLSETINYSSLKKGYSDNLIDLKKLNFQKIKSSHRRCSVKKVFLEISQNLQESTWIRVSESECFSYRTPLDDCFWKIMRILVKLVIVHNICVDYIPYCS